MPTPKKRIIPLRIKILGVEIDYINFSCAVNKICELIKDARPHTVITANSLMLNSVSSSAKLRHAFSKASLVIADGIGIVFAARFLYNAKIERIPGIDLMYTLCGISSKNGYSVYILGAKERVNRDAIIKLQKRFPEIKIIGRHHGYFSPGEEEGLLNKIRKLKPDIVFVGIDVPRQEEWVSSNIERMGSCLCIGIGGSLDVISGRLLRAPQWMRESGLEWIHRFMLQPWRIKRLLGLPVFLLKVLLQKLGRDFGN